MEKQKELEEIAAGPFARTVDDPKLEKMRKETIHSDDPMAEYIMRKRRKHSREASVEKGNETTGAARKSNKPMYSGPKVPINRFGILPGYRWDGIERGTQLEKRLLIKMNERSGIKEDEYRYLNSDL